LYRRIPLEFYDTGMDFVETKWRQWNDFYASCLDQSDARVADWFMMQSYSPTLLLSLTYLVVVYSLMHVMRQYKPMELRGILLIYNSSMVALNFHIAFELFTASWKRNYSYSCTPVNYSDDPEEVRIAKAIWWFYISKAFEFLDTIFFVLRKKNEQVTFLHVYHHATMFPIWWIGVKWVPGGQSLFGAMINSSVHVIIYSYYALSALGPEFQKFLWWKRYLTKIQLTQFCFGIFHAAQSLYFGCDFPSWMQWALIFYAFTILLLFLNFYFHAYILPLNKQTKKSKVSASSNNGHVKSEHSPSPQTMKINESRANGKH
jgi:elongation of very long chain fatty acids protein 4